MSSCISGAGAIDIIKPLSTSPAAPSPLRSAHSSPTSSALSEASNGNGFGGGALAIKKARAPRKRPNTAYNEAAALLASIYPSVFPAKKCAGGASAFACRRQSGEQSSAVGQPDLLPRLPMLGDAGFLLRDAGIMNEVSALASPKNCLSPSPVNSPCSSSTSAVVIASTFERRPVDGAMFDVDNDADFDTESILDEESDEGIDSIMGCNLSADTNNDSLVSGDTSSGKNANVRLMMLGIAGNAAIKNIRHALKRSGDNGAWWMSPAVPVADISVPPASTTDRVCSSEAALPKKKSSKKKPRGKEESATEGSVLAAVADAAATGRSARARLGLKLDAEKVISAWSGSGPVFADVGPDSPPTSAEALAKLADIDLFTDNGVGDGESRKASVQRYKEKRQTRLFSKKIRYQVRKTNADSRPRTKGKFARSPLMLPAALKEES